MPTPPNRSLARLLQQGVAIETSPGGRSLWVRKLSFETAIKLGHALTVQLDASHDKHGMYAAERYTLEAAFSEANKRLGDSETTVFGETRPADRNLSVRVEQGHEGFLLIADVRNDYEDRPELEGGRILQLGFIAASGTLDL